MRALMKEAADLGNVHSQAQLGRMYFFGEGGAVDHVQSLYYSTLAYENCQTQDMSADLDQDQTYRAAFHMGCVFQDGCLEIDESLHLATHYYKIAFEGGYNNASVPLAYSLLKLHRSRYRNLLVTGHNCTPRVLLYARKGREVSDPNVRAAASELVENIVMGGQQYCANNCGRAEQLKACVRCKAVWYCGKDCQVEHWKAGHKIDCVKYV